ncbi:hypothetical protein B7494_g6315 [Chlorociboria aeruginascens]|nr:hypothetical protein B7494_g6315 [Chlorociboria aeruginascens]
MAKACNVTPHLDPKKLEPMCPTHRMTGSRGGGSPKKSDGEGLNITVTSGNSTKPKGKARAEGLEILTNASLKLKAGVHYALVGRNGTGKSSEFIAVTDHLKQNRTDLTDANGSEDQPRIELSSSLSVLEEVVDRATSRSEIQREADILSKAIDGNVDLFAPLRAFRQVQHEHLMRELFEHDKDARLRSGARGMAARKALIAFEKRVAESNERVGQKNEEIDEAILKEETNAAIDLLAELQAQLEPTRIAEIEVKARNILTGIGFPKTHFEKPVNTLSGGWQMRTNLASILLCPTDLLILDEPTNFLDLLGIIWLQKYLLSLRNSEPNPPTVIFVSHDRDFVNSICQEIIILRDKELTYFRGDLTSYEKSIEAKKLYLGRMKENQEKQKAHIQQTISQNIKHGKAAGDENKLRQAKSRQKKLDNRMGLQVSAKGGRFKLNRDFGGYNLTARAEIEVPVDEKGTNITLPPAPNLRFPGPLVSLENVNYIYPPVKPSKTKPPPTLQNINLTIYMGDRIGIIGLNGSGKSTLLKLLTETLKPTSGTITHHPRLRMGYYSQDSITDLQNLSHASPELTALSLLAKNIKDTGQEDEFTEQDIRGLLGGLGLPGRIASDIPLGKLSGGQLVRLSLALVIWREPQFLVLDEVTTHLDFSSVNALADALGTWNGAVVVVSHDRFFVRGVVEGEVRDEDGDSNDGEEDVERRRWVGICADIADLSENIGSGSTINCTNKRASSRSKLRDLALLLGGQVEIQAAEQPKPALVLPTPSKPVSLLETLPPELKSQILFSLSLADLSALVHASPAFHQCYLLNRKALLFGVLRTELGSVLIDAFAAYISEFLELQQLSYLRQVTEFLTSYEELRSTPSPLDVIQEKVSLKNAIDLVQFFSITRVLATEFANSALTYLPISTKSEPLSRTERMRILRAFYRLQICCNLFGANHRKHWDLLNSYETLNISCVDILRLFFCIFEPWEVEEIACVHAFMGKKYEQIFRSIQFDVSRDNPKFANKLARYGPLTPDGCFDFDTEDSVINLREGTISRGLRLFYKALNIKDHAHLVDLMSSNIGRCYFNFILDALERTPQHERRWHWVSDRDQAQDTNEELPFHRDSEHTPPLAWVIIWKGTYSNIYGDYIPNKLREWGYVMWDVARLVRMDAKKVLAETWAETWGHDPRIEFR